jgi:hypothetical protein
MPKGEAVRTEHIIQSFVRMTTDPQWGVPTHIYCDNGGEYNWIDLTTSLSKLKHAVSVHVGEAPPDGNEGVHRARPYNARAKVIETRFAVLERSIFSQLPGYVGGDRMRKKTANQGHAPTPFPGDRTRIREAFDTALAYYHIKKQSGHLAGKSPNESFAAFVAAGWTATVLDPWELAVAFSREFVKPVRAGGTVRLDTVDFRADALQSLVGSKVLVRQPLFGDRQMLFVFSVDGQPLDIARPDLAYSFGDAAGAAEQSRRQSALLRDVRALKADADPDAGGERAMAEVVKLFGDPARALPPEAVIHVNPEISEAARMAKNAPARAQETRNRKQVQMAEKLQFLERLANAG